MNNKIIPALMPKSFNDIESHAAMVRNKVKTIQLDLMDGKYVPESTWPFAYTNDYDLEDLKKEDNGFPFWEDLNYELDLMVSRPEEKLDTWLNIGASRVIFHYASIHDWDAIKNIDHVARNFVEIGLAITIHDNIEDIYPLIDEKIVDFIQVMGIAHIGYQGEPFDQSCIDIITTLRDRYPDLVISIDGGVSENTITGLRDAGVTRFVSGSGIFGGGMADENICDLQDILDNNK